MEGKGVTTTAAAVCIMLILLSSGKLQQVSAKSAIKRCYDDCMPDCEEDSPRAACKVLCFTCCVLDPNHNCTQGRESTSSAAAPAFAGDGFRKISVLSSISGVDAATEESGATDAGAADCVDGCKKN